MTPSDWHQEVQQIIQAHQIQLVRVCVQDLGHMSRCREVPSGRFLERMATDGLSFPSALFAFDSSARIVPGAGPGPHSGYPSWHLQPDLSTFSVLPYAPGVARVIADPFESKGQPVDYAPRHVLRRVLERVRAAGFQVKGSFEFEFYAFARDGDSRGQAPIPPDSISPGPSSLHPPGHPAWTGLQCFSEIKQAALEPLLIHLIQTLEAMGARPEVANTEYGPGQFEISYASYWNLEIADMAFYYRTTIREVLAQHGLKATFMSKPLSGFSGSGAHLHHGLYGADGANAFADPKARDGLSQLCRWFIGGQLAHARTVSALMNPTINGYKRLQPGAFAPHWITWGYDHRETMIRVPPARGEATRIENRLPGADTDPYLALAAALAAGLDGIERRIDPGDPVAGRDVSEMAAPVLPRSLSEALDAFEEDPWTEEVFGRSFKEQFLRLRRAEVERFLRHVTDWEWMEYEDIF
ncbi:glutamine synthetase family protein [Kyrpidia spormannii]|uniref:Glutamate--ammonia ligase n=1 Tax=Kyrpidia spormannii TaxID=2055160 RepID=A0A6F9EB14_9BACL|nr:glutamine synthetase [Kyrpidia spormannii]CAB3393664.1 Glutamate--ammonia ligase [Kyrpidia spormannii]